MASSKDKFEALCKFVTTNLVPCLYCAFYCRSNNLTDLPDDISQLAADTCAAIEIQSAETCSIYHYPFPQLLVLELSGNQISRLDGNIAKVCSAA